MNSQQSMAYIDTALFSVTKRAGALPPPPRQSENVICGIFFAVLFKLCNKEPVLVDQIRMSPSLPAATKN